MKTGSGPNFSGTKDLALIHGRDRKCRMRWRKFTLLQLPGTDMRKPTNDPKADIPNTDEAAPGETAANDALKKIRDRLDQELPSGIYVTEDEFVKLLGGKAKKTLQNMRSKEREKEEKIYPIPIRLGNSRPYMYPRSVIVDWLAKQELICTARIIHRCR
jgi:hypothetical protein